MKFENHFSYNDICNFSGNANVFEAVNHCVVPHLVDIADSDFQQVSNEANARVLSWYMHSVREASSLIILPFPQFVRSSECLQSIK